MHFFLALLLGGAHAVLIDQPAAAQTPAVSKRPTAATTQKPLATAPRGTDGKSSTSDPPAPSAAKPRNPRVLLITAEEHARCAEELARLRRPGGDFERLRGRGWKIGAGAENHLQLVNYEAVPEIVAQLGPSDFPLVACVEDGEVIRSFREGCTTPLDMWTFGWLAKGIDERPPAAVLESARVESTGSYPLRGNHWSIDGNSNPSREYVISHLRGPNHAAYIQASQQIEDWSYEELRSLHDDLHERYGGGVSRPMRSGSSGRSADQFSAGRKVKGR